MYPGQTSTVLPSRLMPCPNHGLPRTPCRQFANYQEMATGKVFDPSGKEPGTAERKEGVAD
jgi:hypothetical protein